MKFLYSRFRKRIKLKSTFQKLIISYVIIISIILLILSVVMYRGYKNQIIEQSGAISQKLLNQGEYYSEYTLRWAGSYIYQLYLDKDVYGLMFNRNIQNADMGIGKIKQAAVIQPSIQSIYIFNNGTKMVYPSDGEPEYFTIYDKDIEELLKVNDETMSTKFIPRKISKEVNGKEYEKNVLTLMLRNVNASYSSLPHGAIILNLDAASVQSYFENMSEKDYSIFAIDNDGRVILNSDPASFLQNISDRDYIRKVLESKEDKGRFTTKIDGKPSIVSYKNSSRLGMKFISIIPYETLTGSINSMLVELVKSSVLLLLLGIVVAFFLFKKIYSPVDRTFKTLRNYLTSNNPEIGMSVKEKSEDEVDYMSKIVEIIVNEPLPFSKLAATDLKFIKKQLLTGLLFNTTLEINGLKSKLEELGVNISFSNIAVILLKIDSYKVYEAEHTRQQSELLKSTLYKEFHGVMEGNFNYEQVVTDEDEFCMIINIEDEEAARRLQILIQEYQHRMQDNHGVSITAAIGDSVDDLEDAAKSYKSAKNYAYYRLKYGLGTILHKSKVEEGTAEAGKYDEEAEEAFLKELRAGNFAKVELELDRVFEMIGRMTYSDMVLAISRFLDSSQRVLANMLQLGKSDMAAKLEELISSISKLDTIEEKKGYMLNLCNDAINEMKEKRKNRKNEVVESVIGYINQNFSQPVLSPDTIAENMKLSPNYLRVLFKDTEGKSLSNYINEVRFEKAKNLLETTDYTVAEIAEKVGIANHNYFYTAFKKYYGVSPNNYRNSIKS